MLSSDHVLKTIKPMMTGSLRGPISAPKQVPKVLEALWRLMNLLMDVRFTAGTFNAQTLLESNHDRVIAAGQSLFKTLIPPIGVRDPADNPTSPIVTTDRQTRCGLRWIRFSYRSTASQVVNTRDRPVVIHISQKKNRMI